MENPGRSTEYVCLNLIVEEYSDRRISSRAFKLHRPSFLTPTTRYTN